MVNFTLSIEKGDLRKAHEIALQQGTSLDAVIREFIKEYIDRDQSQQLVDKILQSIEMSGYVGDGDGNLRNELYK